MIYSDTNVNENVNYLAGCNPINVTPSYATLDEMAFYVAESNEMDFNNMMMSIGISELAYLERTGEELVYEDGNEGGESKGKIKTLVDKVVGMFKKMWEKVQGMISNAISTLSKKAEEFRRKVMSNYDEKHLKEKVKSLSADKDFGESYEYAKVDEYSSGVVSKIDGKDKEVDSLVAAATNDAKNGSPAKLDELDDKLTAIVDGVCQSIAGSKDPSGIVTKMKDDLRGARKKYTGAVVKNNWNEIYEEVIKFPKTRKTLKKNYTDLQKSFNNAIKSAKKSAHGKDFNASAYTKAVKAYKNLRQITVYAQQAIISVVNERQSFYRSIVFKIIGTKKPKADKKAVGESTTYDRVSSLFEW